jgi:effector-binding domain-containing protein
VTAPVALKEVPATIFVVSSHDDVTIPEIPAITRSELDQLVEALDTVGGAPTAPVTFIYRGADGTNTTRFHLDLAIPVRTRPAMLPEPYEVLEAPAFRCVATDYVGPMAHIQRGYDTLFAEMRARGLTRTEESREIYKKWIGFESPDNVTELQIGVR